jgi:predicted nucleic acid-binding protein
VLVLDASVVVASCWTDEGFRPLAGEELFAPPLMWSEVRSSLHEGVWRGDLGSAEAWTAHHRLEQAPIRLVADERVGERAWRIADELGWARTYDAEYVALAQILGCRLVTLDLRLRRGADRLGCVVLPSEL